MGRAARKTWDGPSTRAHPQPADKGVSKPRRTDAERMACVMSLVAALLTLGGTTIITAAHFARGDLIAQQATTLALQYLPRFEAGTALAGEPHIARNLMWRYLDRALQGSVADQVEGHSGKPRVEISDDDMSKILARVANPFFSSLSHLLEDPELLQYTDKYGIGMRTLLERVKEKEPSFGKRLTVTFKMPLSEKHKQARESYANMMLLMLNMALPLQAVPLWTPSPSPLQSVPMSMHKLKELIVYLDQKTIYISPKGDVKLYGLTDPERRKFYTDLHPDLSVEWLEDHSDQPLAKMHPLSQVRCIGAHACTTSPCHPKPTNHMTHLCDLLQSTYKYWKIYAYLAVNWFTGALHVQLCSGSHPYNTKFKVSQCHKTTSSKQ